MVLVLTVILIGIMGFLLENGSKIKQRKALCFIIFTLLVIPMGLRSIYYGGVDTIVYANDFKRICNMTNPFDAMTIQDKDYVFYLVAFLFSRICKDVNVWIFFNAVFYLIVVVRFLYKYSLDITLSIFMFIFYEYYLYNFQLMRHVCGLAFIIISYDYLIRNEKIKFIVTVLIGSLFSGTAILFLPAIFLVKPKIGLKQWTGILIGCFAIFFLSSKPAWISFVNMLSHLIPNGQRLLTYTSPKRAGRITFLYQFIFVFISWWLIKLYNLKKVSNYNPLILKEKSNRCTLPLIGKNTKFIPEINNYNLMINLGSVAVVLFLGRIIVGESYRIAQLYSISTIVLVPNVLKEIPEKQMGYLLAALIILYGAYHYYSLLFADINRGIYWPYLFFWS